MGSAGRLYLCRVKYAVLQTVPHDILVAAVGSQEDDQGGIQEDDQDQDQDED